MMVVSSHLDTFDTLILDIFQVRVKSNSHKENCTLYLKKSSQGFTRRWSAEAVLILLLESQNISYDGQK